MDDFKPLDSDGEEELWQKLHAVCKERLGTTNILYGFTHSIHLSTRVGVTKGLFIKHSYDKAYVDALPNGQFLDDEISASLMHTSTGPVLWEEMEDHSEMTEAQKRRWDIDIQFGVKAGVSIGFRFFNNRGLSGFGLASCGLDYGTFERLWKRDEQGHVALLTAFERVMRPAIVRNHLRLTPREKECLSLSVGGMSAKEIGHQLGITERSVFNILNRARKSLKAGNTIEAVAKALAYDLI